MVIELSMKPEDLYNNEPVLRIPRKEVLKAYNEDKAKCYEELRFIQEMYCTTFCFDHMFSDGEFQGIIDVLLNTPSNCKCFVELRISPRYIASGDNRYEFSHNSLDIVIVSSRRIKAVVH